MNNAQSFLKNNVILNSTVELLSAQNLTIGVDYVSSKLWKKENIYLFNIWQLKKGCFWPLSDQKAYFGTTQFLFNFQKDWVISTLKHSGTGPSLADLQLTMPSLDSVHTTLTCCLGIFSLTYRIDWRQVVTQYTIFYQEKPSARLVSILHLVMKIDKVTENMMSKSKWIHDWCSQWTSTKRHALFA